MKLKIKKGDMVMVIAGRSQKTEGTQADHWERGKTGRVIRVFPKTMRILVEGINVRKKHEKPNAANQQGGIIEREMPIHYSNVQLVDSDGVPVRVGIEDRDGKKIRVVRTKRSKDYTKELKN